MNERSPLVLAVADLAYSGGSLFDLMRLIVDHSDFQVDLQSVPLTDVVMTARRRRPALVIIGHRPLPDDEVLVRWKAAGSPIGGDIIQALKADPDTNDIPVLLLEALWQMEEMASEWGADAYLELPTSPKQFVDAVEELIAKPA